MKTRTGCQCVGYLYYSENLSWAAKRFDCAGGWAQLLWLEYTNTVGYERDNLDERVNPPPPSWLNQEFQKNVFAICS